MKPLKLKIMVDFRGEKSHPKTGNSLWQGKEITSVAN